MRTTETLRTEHGWIRAMLDCLGKLVEDSRGPAGLNPDLAAELVFLFEDFVDGQHKRKEEEIVFPRVLVKASDSDERVLAQLLEDHVYERAVMENLRSSLAGALGGDPPRLSDFAEDAGACLVLHRKHLEDEDATLLPMLERILDAEDDAEIERGFHHLEALGPNPAGVLERIRALCHRLDVPEPGV